MNKTIILHETYQNKYIFGQLQFHRFIVSNIMYNYITVYIPIFQRFPIVPRGIEQFS